ncbi:hypothetical protein Bra3105_06650 [Brachybacterium halotolerans subsp. kimchii]|uniref:hypothetical protein n=1 Tax=Brachybacterium halotolerans TaxID=2795215 RepID=UPI001E28267E|nr:hypothetical protein [Brachybacterium halotolerans]UEJ83986.1 hypothetical protein Bra3105_06650 [Brachybacterium halotolerans subsp. kimchii]
MNIDITEQVLMSLNRAGLVDAKTGQAVAWNDALEGLPAAGVWEAVRHFNREGVPEGRLFLRASDIRKRVLAKIEIVPFHLRCPDHPNPQYRAAQCPQCRKQIEAPNPDVVAKVKMLARQLDAEGKMRDAERVAELQRKADESAARAREKLEKQRQLTEYEASAHPGGGFSASEEKS